MQVLVVEDDDISREMLAHALASGGFDVLTAADGIEALERLRATSCRLVVTDWEMPRLDGVGLCEAIRGGELAGYVYLVLLTSHDSPQKTVQALSAGADDFIKKPFDAAELVVRVRAGERVLALESREVAIFALAKLAESRDPDAGAHLERVSNYCRALAARLGQEPAFAHEIDAEFIHLIHTTSPLHDIGKVGIPDAILLKAGPLTEEETAVMRSHAQRGAETLEAALSQFPHAKFLKMARDIAATHHERWDGTGYPRGLAGTDTPLCGRIMAVADVYDALTSPRVYKPAYSHELAQRLIVEGSGTSFDPAIVQAFLDCQDAFAQIRRRYAAEEAVIEVC